MRLFATGAMNWVMGKALPDDVPHRGEDGHQGHRAGPEHRRAAQRRDPQERPQVRRGPQRAAQGHLRAAQADPRRRRPARRDACEYAGRGRRVARRHVLRDRLSPRTGTSTACSPRSRRTGRRSSPSTSCAGAAPPPTSSTSCSSPRPSPTTRPARPSSATRSCARSSARSCCRSSTALARAPATRWTTSTRASTCGPWARRTRSSSGSVRASRCSAMMEPIDATTSSTSCTSRSRRLARASSPSSRPPRGGHAVPDLRPAGRTVAARRRRAGGLEPADVRSGRSLDAVRWPLHARPHPGPGRGAPKQVDEGAAASHTPVVKSDWDKTPQRTLPLWQRQEVQALPRPGLIGLRAPRPARRRDPRRSSAGRRRRARRSTARPRGRPRRSAGAAGSEEVEVLEVARAVVEALVAHPVVVTTSERTPSLPCSPAGRPAPPSRAGRPRPCPASPTTASSSWLRGPLGEHAQVERARASPSSYSTIT